MRDREFNQLNRKESLLYAVPLRWHGRGAFLALGLLAASAVAAADSADPKRYLDDIKALTPPAMEGRGDGTPGLTLAADLIEQRFRSPAARRKNSGFR